MSLISRCITLKNHVKSPLLQLTRYLNNSPHPRIPTAPPQVFSLLTNTNHWIYKENDKINVPLVNKIQIEFPNGLKWVPPLIEPIRNNKIDKIIIDPLDEHTKNTPLEAARMIVIRRKKMKKHKLRKLRKRMKYEWAKLRQRRELKKERAFQAELIQQCKEAENFSAEKYVEERINKLNEIVIPRFWKGRRLPEFLIRQKMGLPPK